MGLDMFFIVAWKAGHVRMTDEKKNNNFLLVGWMEKKKQTLTLSESEEFLRKCSFTNYCVIYKIMQYGRAVESHLLLP